MFKPVAHLFISLSEFVFNMHILYILNTWTLSVTCVEIYSPTLWLSLLIILMVTSENRKSSLKACDFSVFSLCLWFGVFQAFFLLPLAHKDSFFYSFWRFYSFPSTSEFYFLYEMRWRSHFFFFFSEWLCNWCITSYPKFIFFPLVHSTKIVLTQRPKDVRVCF